MRALEGTKKLSFSKKNKINKILLKVVLLKGSDWMFLLKVILFKEDNFKIEWVFYITFLVNFVRQI